MKAVIKAFKVLETFCVDQPEFAFTEIVNATGLGRTNTHKLLKTLVSLNCLSQNANRAPYRLGPKLFEIGNHYIAQLNLCKVAMPYLVKLAEDFENSVYLCIENKGEALCLERIDGPSNIKVTVLQRGGQLPLHVGAAPLVLLAGMKDQKIAKIMHEKGFKKYTENTVQKMDQLMEKIGKIRKYGYAESWEDVTIGVASYGAPVVDASGEIIAAISIGGILLRFEGERKKHLVNLVKETALAVSKDLGYA